MDASTIFTGVVAVLTGAGGVILVIREFRRRDRRNCQEDIDTLSEDLHLLRQDFSHLRRWAFLMRQQAIDAGVDASDPPEPRPLAPVDPDGIRRSSRSLRHLWQHDDGDGGQRDGGGA